MVQLDKKVKPLQSISLRRLDLTELDCGDNFLQTGFWGNFKSSGAWTSHAFGWTAPDKKGCILVLERALPCGQSMAYIPYGPVIPQDSKPKETTAFLVDLATALGEKLHARNFMVRFDLRGGTMAPVGKSIAPPSPLLPPLRKAAYRVQPADTTVLQITGDDTVLMAGMHKKTRYNIRLAERKGVQVRCYTGAETLDVLPTWYALYRETGIRDGIALHSESYYRDLFENFLHSKRNDFGLFLYMAYYEKVALAGIVVVRCGKRATYLYGASGSRKRALMPNHLLQWTAIRDARDMGVAHYDFHGIPPTDHTKNPMHGLWRFKTGFGGTIHHYHGAWDYPLRPMVYRIYSLVENLRGKIVALRKHRR